MIPKIHIFVSPPYISFFFFIDCFFRCYSNLPDEHITWRLGPGMVSLIIVALSKPFNALFHFAIPTDKTYVELITKENEEEGEARYDSTQTPQEIVNL